MKKVNVYDYLDFRDLLYGLRPSVAEKVKWMFYRISASEYRKLCKKREEELLREPEVTPDILNRIKSFLADRGLRLEMTEQELDAYLDEEYYACHPKEQQVQVEKSFDTDGCEPFELTSDDEEQFNKRVAETEGYIEEEKPQDAKVTEVKADGEEPKKQFDLHKEIRRAFAETINDPVRVMRPDWEWFRHQARLDMLQEQPWLVKLFFPFRLRVRMAFDNADTIMEMYQTNAISRSMVYRKMQNDGTFKKLLLED